jgi:O-antigen/teichoic acid export membrane protein
VVTIVQRLLERLPSSAFFRGALRISAGASLAQLILILSSPVLTRLFVPADYGAYAVATSILAILVAVATLGYEFAIPLPRSEEDAANVVAVCLIVVIAMSLGTAVIMVLAGGTIATVAGAPSLGPYLPILALGVLSGGISTALIGWAIRTRTYSEIVANRLTQSGTLVAAQVGFGLLGAGAPGLFGGAIVGSLAACIRLASATWGRWASTFRGVTRRGISAAASRYRRFPLFTSPSILLNTLGLEAAVLVVVALYGTDVGGHFALAQRVIQLPVTVVGVAIAQVYFAEAAQVARERPSDLRRLFWRTTRALMAVAIAPAVLGGLAAPFLFGPVFGDAWHEAGQFVAILAPMYFLIFVTSPTGATLDILERQDLRLVREIVRLVLIAGVILLALNLHLTALAAVAAVSVAGCLTYLFFGFLSWRAIVAHQERGHTTSPRLL